MRGRSLADSRRGGRACPAAARGGLHRAADQSMALYGPPSGSTLCGKTDVPSTAFATLFMAARCLLMLSCISLRYTHVAARVLLSHMPPAPPSCPTAAPAGFTAAAQQGWWVDPSCANMRCAKPDIEHRHGISVECCAEYCAADPECKGFEVYEPCANGYSDCYVYHHIDNSTFTPHPGAHSFSWTGARPPVRNLSKACVPTPKICDHPVIVDDQQKILPWSANNASAGGGAGAYEYSARLAWSWFTDMPKQDGYPLFFFFGSYISLPPSSC